MFSTSGNNAISVGDPDAAVGPVSAVVSDSSFETPAGTSALGRNVGGWNFTTSTGRATARRTASGIAGYGGYNNYYTQDGKQAAYIQGNGTMWQDVYFADAGNYTLSFLAAARDACKAAGIRSMVQIDGVNVGTITPTDIHYQAYQTNAFSVTAGTHRVTFTGLCPAGTRSDDVYRSGVDRQRRISSSR